MEKYEFELLAWLDLSDSEAKLGAAWYKGAGWYLNKKGKPARSLGVSELEALNQCGAEGWSVAAWVPKKDEPHYILQRRIAG